MGFRAVQGFWFIGFAYSTGSVCLKLTYLLLFARRVNLFLARGGERIKKQGSYVTLTLQVPTIKGPRGSSTLYSRYLGVRVTLHARSSHG